MRADGDRRADGGSFIPAIQGLRGWAALSVLLVHSHFMPILAGLWPAELVPGWLALPVATGGRGVELFFVISGFLIPASLRRHGSLPRFFTERVLRIVPVFLVLNLIVYAVGPWIGYKLFAGMGPMAYAASFTANVLFLAPLLDMPLAQQNAWSLTYEWLFYAWVAAAYCALAERGRHWLLVPLAAVAAGIAWHLPSTSYFALGMAFSLASPRIRLGGGAGLALGLAALAGVYVVCEYVSVFLGLVPAAVAFALALDPGNGFARLLARPSAQYLGRISYSLYLVHPFVLFGMIVAARRIGGAAAWSGPAALLFAAVGIGLSVAAAAVCHDLVERRLRGRIEAYLRSRRPEAEAAPLDGPTAAPRIAQA